MAEKKVKEAQLKTEKISIKQMYIGPSIKKYGIASGTIYDGEFPSNMAEAVKEFPEIKFLFVNIDKELAYKKSNLNKKGTKENITFKAILKKLGGK